MSEWKFPAGWHSHRSIDFSLIPVPQEDRQ